MAATPMEVIRFIGRSSKRIAVTIVGGALVLAGLAMLVLPGPAVIVIPLGFAVLATEYAWAAVALEKSKRFAEQAGTIAKENVTRAARGAKGTAGALGRRFTRRQDPTP